MLAALALAILCLAILELKDAALSFYVGRDFELYRTAASRWITGGPFYEPYQLVGPYQVEHGAILYPPLVLYLLVPFIVVPSIFWWVVPVAVLGGCLVRLSPHPASWPVMAIMAVYPNTLIKIMTGNPVLWMVMFVGLGTVYYWPAALALLKPTLAPLALFGSWTRRWWLALGAMVVATIPLAGLIQPYVTATLNARTPEGLLYSLGEVPMMLIPITAWIARSKGNATGERSQ